MFGRDSNLGAETTSRSRQLRSSQPRWRPVHPAPPTRHSRQEIERGVVRVDGTGINNRLCWRSLKRPGPLVALMMSFDQTALWIKGSFHQNYKTFQDLKWSLGRGLIIRFSTGRMKCFWCLELWIIIWSIQQELLFWEAVQQLADGPSLGQVHFVKHIIVGYYHTASGAL